jgi:hypothetical protein
MRGVLHRVAQDLDGVAMRELEQLHHHRRVVLGDAH